MKNIKKSILPLFILFLISSCSLIQNLNTYINVYDCEHGSLEVKIMEENLAQITYLIIAHPDTGYCLQNNNLYIFDYDDYKYRYIAGKTDKDNCFTLTADKKTKLTISAFFTKIGQE